MKYTYLRIYFRPIIPLDTSLTTSMTYDVSQRTGNNWDRILAFVMTDFFLAVPPQIIPGAIQPPIYHQAVGKSFNM